MQSAGITVAGSIIFVCLAGFAYKRYKNRTDQSRKRALSRLEQNVSIRDLFTSNSGLYDRNINMQTNPMHIDPELSDYMTMPINEYEVVRKDESEHIVEMEATLKPDEPGGFYCDENIILEESSKGNIKLYQNPLARRASAIMDT